MRACGSGLTDLKIGHYTADGFFIEPSMLHRACSVSCSKFATPTLADAAIQLAQELRNSESPLRSWGAGRSISESYFLKTFIMPLLPHSRNSGFLIVLYVNSVQPGRSPSRPVGIR